MSWFYELFGGGDNITDTDCQTWLSNKTKNPKTGRTIGPTASGRGVYHDYERACLERGYVAEQPNPVAQPPKLTHDDKPIIRTNAGRKSPAMSATSVAVGTKHIGQDGQMYIVRLRSNSSQYWQPCSQKTANC